MKINQNREREINYFLTKLANVAKTNFVTPNYVYSELKRYNIPKHCLGSNEHLFNEWIDTFRYKENINVFVSPQWKYFCQFKNTPENTYEEPVKIYLSLDKEHIYEGANLLFSYLAQNNIKHASKIAKDNRTDNVVIRVYSKDDAYKVINFINNNKYLNEGHQQINPFCFKKGIVGLAMDNYHSYNMTVATLISEYIFEKRNNGSLDFVSVEDLSQYIKNYRLENSTLIEEERDLIYVEEIRNLILTSLNSDDIHDFDKHYYNVSSNTHLSKKVPASKESENLILDVLNKTYQITAENHDNNFALSGLLEYLEMGRENGISRMSKTGEKGRELLKYINYQEAKKVVLDYGKTNNLYEAINKLFNKDKMLEDLNKATIGTAEKYGDNQAVSAITIYIIAGDITYFTREDKNQNPIRDLLRDYDYEKVREKLINIYLKDYDITDVNEINELFFLASVATHYYENYCDSQNNTIKK